MRSFPPQQIRVLAVAWTVLIASPMIRAQTELTAVPNRPTVSTPATPVQPGVLETEWGINAAATHQDINGLFKFGVTKDFELRFTHNPFTADSGTHGVGDTGVGFKHRLMHDSGNLPAVAVMYMAKLPTAGDVLGSGETDHAFTLLVSKDLGKHRFDFNLIANLLGRPQGGFERSYLNALAWSHHVRGKWGITGELYGITSPNTPGSAQALLAGTYAVKPRLFPAFEMVARSPGIFP